jgi:hypothetical protein
MLSLNPPALRIYRWFDGTGPFHAAAVASLATLLPGDRAMRRPRDPRAVERHHHWMT